MRKGHPVESQGDEIAQSERDNPMNSAALVNASIAPEVRELRPDYRALLIQVAGVIGGPTDASSDAALAAAERAAREHLAGAAPETLPEIEAWRDAFRAFGVKPREGRSSVEALLRRLEAGLPRIDRLTDHYNAISVRHLLPIGGEDLDRYVGVPRLVRASGTEPFDTIADGEVVEVHPEPGEVVWVDDQGVTCRRWNWRQCVRTRLSPETRSIVFILDALEPTSDAALLEAGRSLIAAITADAPSADAASVLLPEGVSV